MKLLSKRLQKRILSPVCRWVAPVFLKGIYGTSRIRVENEEYRRDLEQEDQNFVLAFWHGQMLPLLSYFQGAGLYTFISPHRDGEYVARALEGMGNHCVRTSLRDRSIRALGEALKLTREGESLAITPDGPLGPAFEAKPGVIKLSEKVECPILPVVGLSSRCRFLESWDRFCLPYPFGEIVVRMLPPVRFWETSQSMEEKQSELQSTLNQATSKLAKELLPDPGDYLEDGPAA